MINLRINFKDRGRPLLLATQTNAVTLTPAWDIERIRSHPQEHHAHTDPEHADAEPLPPREAQPLITNLNIWHTEVLITNSDERIQNNKRSGDKARLATLSPQEKEDQKHQ